VDASPVLCGRSGPRKQSSAGCRARHFLLLLSPVTCNLQVVLLERVQVLETKRHPNHLPLAHLIEDAAICKERKGVTW
jgi:hypothetical protein